MVNMTPGHLREKERISVAFLDGGCHAGPCCTMAFKTSCLGPWAFVDKTYDLYQLDVVLYMPVPCASSGGGICSALEESCDNSRTKFPAVFVTDFVLVGGSNKGCRGDLRTSTHESSKCALVPGINAAPSSMCLQLPEALQGAGRARLGGQGATAPSFQHPSLSPAVQRGQECCEGDGGLSTSCSGYPVLLWSKDVCDCGCPVSCHQLESSGSSCLRSCIVIN